VTVKQLANLFGISEDKILHSFTGAFSQEMVEDKTHHINANLNTPPRIISLYIELAQNIQRYSDDQEGIIILGDKGSSQFLAAANKVGPIQKTVLSQRLAYLERCTINEINKVYKQQLKVQRGAPHSKGGASLGLFELFRKGDEIRYHFHQTPEKEDIFCIFVKFYSPS